MVEPVTALAIGGLTWVFAGASGIAGGVLGNVSDRSLQNLTRGIRDRVAGWRSLPANDHVARAVRLAQIHALERAIRDWRATANPQWGEPPDATRFCTAALDFCARMQGRCLDAAVKHNLDVTEPLAATIAGILDTPLTDGPADRRAQAIAAFAEDAVIGELREALQGVPLPPPFVAHLREGGQGFRRFLDLFGHFILDQIKNKPAFRDILFATQLSRIESLAFDKVEFLALLEQRFGGSLEVIEATSRRTEVKVDRLGETTSRLEAILRDIAGGGALAVEAVAKLRDFFRPRFADIDAMLIDDFVAFVTENYSKLEHDKAAAANMSGDVREAIEASSSLVGDMRFAEAEALLDKLIEKRRSDREEALREDAALIGQRAIISRFQLRFREAATLYNEAARTVAFDLELQENFLDEAAHALFSAGYRLNDNVAIEESIIYWKERSNSLNRETDSMKWALTQHYIGRALALLGDRENSVAHFEEALVCYQSALAVRHPDDWPHPWRIFFLNIGGMLWNLAIREGSVERLHGAIEAFTAARDECEKNRNMMIPDWGKAAFNLALCKQALAERMADPNIGREALADAEDAVGHYVRTSATTLIPIAQDLRDRLAARYAP